MLFRKVKTPGIAHVAYVLGDAGEAIVVDPRRDVDEYVSIARSAGLRIAYVLETHRQEDFVMGSSELARRLGAKVVSLDHPLFGHSDVKLRDGEEVQLAGVRLKALHTPGHTPESTCYAVYLGASDAAWGVFTGDTLFIGETGRTDLPGHEKTGRNAGVLHDAIHAKLLPLGDHTLVWPAHGAGSVCGADIAAHDESTLGFERTYNPVFRDTRDAFVRRKIEERLPRPPYFRSMEGWNLEGGRPLAKTASDVAVLSAEDFAREMTRGLVIDTREPEGFAAGHVPGSLNVWIGGLPVFGGWLTEAGTRVYLVLERIDDLEVALSSLARIGIDDVEGVLAKGFPSWRNAGMPIERTGTITPRDLRAAQDQYVVLDVRDDHEFEEGHIPGAYHLYVGHLEQHVRRLERELRAKPSIAVTCSVGRRAGIAVSILARHGFHDVKNLIGGMTAWSALDLPQQHGPGGDGASRSITTPDVEGARR